MHNISDPVEKIPLIGPKYKELLTKLDITTIRDLLYHFPTSYKDTSQVSQISDLSIFEARTIICKIDKIRNIRTRSRKYITEAEVSDNSGKIDVIWFNQPFISKTLKFGSKILLNGKLNPKRNIPQLYSPDYELIRKEKPTHLGKITPIYPTTEGITSKWLRSRIYYLISKHQYLLDDIPKVLTQKLAKRYVLVPKSIAISNIHFPKDQDTLKRAKKRLAFEELLAIQIKLVKKIIERKKEKAPKIDIKKTQINQFLDSLPFAATRAQKRVITEITSDFTKPYPANRLLAGDVGCGKTLVAAAVSIPIIQSNYQVAILAPTAILAKQHYETLAELFKEQNIDITLVTGGSKKGKGKNAQLIIGTHALLHRHNDLFDNLALVVVDEQHRFGVKQRETLVSQKNKLHPHKITMTATPIPRSIALTLFGDLDISVIDEMPKGRKATKTYLVPKKRAKDAYQWIENKIKGHKIQVFWICPLIEESDKLQTKAVITEYEKLENDIFPDLRIDILHGKFSEEEKNERILRMKQRKIDILVSTSVIEVGMDIENANIIVIEGAERFGLAQLHQLRGRVGRRAEQDSWCFLFPGENTSPYAVKRLKYFSNVNDGLKVAEFDLENRGPGEVYGTRQAGIPDLKIASLSDTALIRKTREAAVDILKE